MIHGVCWVSLKSRRVHSNDMGFTPPKGVEYSQWKTFGVETRQSRFGLGVLNQGAEETAKLWLGFFFGGGILVKIFWKWYLGELKERIC